MTTFPLEGMHSIPHLSGRRLTTLSSKHLRCHIPLRAEDRDEWHIMNDCQYCGFLRGVCPRYLYPGVVSVACMLLRTRWVTIIFIPILHTVWHIYCRGLLHNRHEMFMSIVYHTYNICSERLQNVLEYRYYHVDFGEVWVRIWCGNKTWSCVLKWFN